VRLLLSESVEPHDFATARGFCVLGVHCVLGGLWLGRYGDRSGTGWHRLRRGRGRDTRPLFAGLVLYIGRRGARVLALANLLELHAKLHGRIEEAVDRLKRHRELFRDAAEREPDLEAAVVDDE